MGALSFFCLLLLRPDASGSPFAQDSAPSLPSLFNDADSGTDRNAGVLCAERCGLSRCGRGVILLSLLRWKEAGPLTEVKPEACGGCVLTAVKPPAFTGVKPDERGTTEGVSGAGDGFPFGLSDILPRLALRAAEARIAGSCPFGVLCSDGFSGEGPGDGVNGPPFSSSSWC